MCCDAPVLLGGFSFGERILPNPDITPCPLRDQEGPPWISEGSCAKPLLPLTPLYASKVATKGSAEVRCHISPCRGQFGLENCVHFQAVVLSHSKESCSTEESVSQGCS